MRKIWILCLLLLCMGIGTAWAAENQSASQMTVNFQGENSTNTTLPRVMVLYLNNAKTDYNAEIDKKVMEHLKQLASNRWELVPGDVYKDKLSAMGVQSFTSAERGDIMNAIKDSDVDALLLIEVEPFNVRDVMTFFTVGKKVTTSIPVKLINRNADIYLYNGKFVEMAQDNTMIGGIGNKSVIMKALDKAFDKFDLLIPEKMVNVQRIDKHRNPAI